MDRPALARRPVRRLDLRGSGTSRGNLRGRDNPARSKALSRRRTPDCLRRHSTLGVHPSPDEHLQRVLIVVLTGLGRRWEAIEAYERLRDALEETYAAEPEPQTKALYRRLLTSGKPLLDAQLPGGEQPPDTQSLVGRQPEWERLWSSWQRASAGDSHLFLITGEAGIGKTHLAEELLTWADQQGIATARTRSYGAEGRLALAPVTEWVRSDDIRQTLGRLADVWLTEVARLLPELLAERPNLPHAEPMTEFGHRQRFFEALARAVLAAPQPLLLLIDDLQWCDQETLQWLHFLLRFDPRKRLSVIGTARQEELLRGHPVAEWLVQLLDQGHEVHTAYNSTKTVTVLLATFLEVPSGTAPLSIPTDKPPNCKIPTS